MRWAVATALAVLASQAAAVDFCSPGSTKATATEYIDQGPFHLDLHPAAFSSNVTDGQPGVPLQLNISVLDTQCQPLVDALVEIWLANATGVYSGFDSMHPGHGKHDHPHGKHDHPHGDKPDHPHGDKPDHPHGDKHDDKKHSGKKDGKKGDKHGKKDGKGKCKGGKGRHNASAVYDLDEDFLRGVQKTDSAGVAAFSTIVPGPYAHRALHVHYAVHLGVKASSSVDQELNSSFISHIGQIFFQDSLLDAIHQIEPYSQVQRVTKLAEDHLFPGDENVIANITQLGNALEDGLVGTVQAIIDPSHRDHFRKGPFGPGADAIQWVKSASQSVWSWVQSAWRTPLPGAGAASRQAQFL